MQVLLEIFLAALKLGLTSFGGPVAHLGYFHREYVMRRRWLGEAEFADLLALCQALPGPASSQLGMAIGRHRGGMAGAVLAWLGFTLPSALAMALLASFWTGAQDGVGFAGVIRGLNLVALVVVAQAVWTMGKRLLPGWREGAVAGVTLVLLAWFPSPFMTAAVLAGAGAAGASFFRRQEPVPKPAPLPGVGLQGLRPLLWLAALVLLLLVLPWAASWNTLASLADSLFRTGALVFGGGHVVLPLLQNELVPHLVGNTAFLAGYGLVQAMPGPLFTLSSFLGFLAAGVPGALVAVAAIFLPSFLILFGVLPYWHQLKERGWFRRALTAVNASVVGLLAWALYDPVFLTAVRTPADGVLALLLGAALFGAKLPPWALALGGAAAGWGVAAAGL